MPATLLASRSTSTMHGNSNILSEEIRLCDERLSSNTKSRSTHSTESSDKRASGNIRRVRASSTTNANASSSSKKGVAKNVPIDNDNNTIEDKLNTSVSSLIGGGSTSRRGRRLVFENDPKSSQRNDRRAIANKLRSENLISSNSSLHSSISHSSFHGSSQHSFHGSSQHSSSTLSFFDSCADDESVGSSNSSCDNHPSRTKNNSRIRRTKSSSKDIKAMQFTASISSALICGDDTDSDSLCGSFSNFSMGVTELNSSFNMLDDDEKSIDNDSISVQKEILKPDTKDKKSSFFRMSSKTSRKKKTENVETTNNNKRSESIGSLKCSLSELKEKDSSKTSRKKRNDSVSNLDSSLRDLKEKDLKKKGRRSSSNQTDSETVDARVGDANNSISDLKEKETKKKGMKNTSSHRDDSTVKKKEKVGIRDSKKQSKKSNLKGCLKTGKRYFERKGPSKEVKFDSKSGSYEKVHMVKSLFKYAKDLWWNESEIEEMFQNQSDFSSSSSNEIISIKAYIDAYCQGRHQVNYEHQLSNETLQELINGYTRGYCGIEAHSNLHDSIVQHVKETNKSIIKAYQNALLVVDQGKRSKMDPSIMVKAHSEALTETDRKWAAAVGKAMKLALND